MHSLRMTGRRVPKRVEKAPSRIYRGGLVYIIQGGGGIEEETDELGARESTVSTVRTARANVLGNAGLTDVDWRRNVRQEIQQEVRLESWRIACKCKVGRGVEPFLAPTIYG